MNGLTAAIRVVVPKPANSRFRGPHRRRSGLSPDYRMLRKALMSVAEPIPDISDRRTHENERTQLVISKGQSGNRLFREDLV